MMCYLQLVPKLSLFAALLGSCIAFTPHGFVRKPFGSLAANKLQKRPSDSPSSASSVVALGSLQEEGRALADRLTGVPVYLVGMMGSGKSTVGNIFCKALGSYSFLETDALVEKAAGCTVAEFFESEGEDQFRQVESAVLTQVSSFVRTVVSTGGGIVTVDANWGKLQSGLVVYLDVPCDVLAKRLVLKASDNSAKAKRQAASSEGGDDDEVVVAEALSGGAVGNSNNNNGKRPLLAGLADPSDLGQVTGRLEEILEPRLSKYMQADLAVKFDGSEALDDCALMVIQKLSAFVESNPSKWQQWKKKAALPEK